MGWRIWAAAVCGLAMAACGGSTETIEEDERLLRRANGDEPRSIDPHLFELAATGPILTDMFEGLFVPSAVNDPLPALAESWTVSGDGLTWTFQVKQSRWSDGTPLTAEDFVWTFRRAMSPDTAAPYVDELYFIENAAAVSRGELPIEALGVAAPNPQTLIMRLERPTFDLPARLMVPMAVAVPGHVIEEHGDAWTMADNIVTNGPYTLEEWRTGDYLALVRNADYPFDVSGCVDRVDYVKSQDGAAAVRRARAGELDIVSRVPPGQAELLDDRLPGWRRVTPQFGVRVLGFNLSEPPYDDTRARRALALAVDTQFLNDEVLLEASVHENRLLPSEFTPGIAVAPDYADQTMDERRAEARALLGELGYGADNPLRVELAYPSRTLDSRAAPAIQADINAIADWVSADLITAEPSSFFNTANNGGYSVFFDGIFYHQPDLMLGFLMSPVPIQGRKSWDDAVYAEAFNRGRDAREDDARAQGYADAERRLLEEHVLSPLWRYTSSVLVDPDVTGWADNPVAETSTRYLCRQSWREDDEDA